MAPPLFQKLLKNHQSSIKFISALNKPKQVQSQFLIPSLVPCYLLDPLLEPSNLYNPILSQIQTSDAISPKSVPIFPSFPFGYCLTPVSSTGSTPDFGAGDMVSGNDDGMMWADSVKKKRKRKMNKHKLKKLRKRLRRKT